MKRMHLMKSAAVVAGLALYGSASAIDLSFTGNFRNDDDVQLFSFSIASPTTVTLRAWSYAGGINAAGQSIARGGFDTILALFDGTGNLIDQNDDGGCGNVGADALTGQCWDTFLQSSLSSGNYTVSIMEYDNFAIGPTLASGFTRSGSGNFTASFSSGSDCGGVQFCDVSGANPGAQRDGHWAFDILNVTTASQIPLPGTLALLGIGIAGLGMSRRSLNG